MNDFTKEELEAIYYNLNEIRESSENLTNPWPLLDKVKSMIENYCQHEWGNVCCGCDLANIYCHKCEKDMS